MGNTAPSKKILREVDGKLSTSEIHLLSAIFRDLARRSPEKTVDPEHFAEYLPVLGLHGSQIFEAFDTDGSKTLDLDEFLRGFARVRGDSVRFFFEIYDLAKDGVVSKNEVQTLLRQLEKDHLAFDESAITLEQFEKWLPSEIQELLDVPSFEEPRILEGCLQKVGATTKTKKQRYFVLAGTCLYYYNRKGDPTPKGILFLGGCQIEAVDEKAFRIVHFDAEDLGQRQTTLYAASRKERNLWISALTTALAATPKHGAQ